ncbi:MAG: hypothetical protein RL616_2330, partial [Verrucomicrobiota bacterium]
MKSNLRFALAAILIFTVVVVHGETNSSYQIFVSNEKSGTLTVISGADFKVTATIPVGKRPRGLHASPDGKLIYVALSGTPISAPPKLDANGNPVFDKKADDDDAQADKAADGIGMVDVAAKKFLRKIPAGSDPEQFSLSADGRQLYVSNEDVGTASVLDITNGRVAHIIRVSREPEGVATRPDGKVFYVTCETVGEIYAVDAATAKVIAQFTVGGRPRSAEFLPDGSRAFIPSESSGELHVIDSQTHQVLQTVALPKGARPMCVKVSADAQKIYVSTGRAG